VLPDELKILLDETDEEDTRIYIDAADFSKVEPEIALTVITENYEGKEGVRQSWLLTIKQHRASKIFSEFSARLEILDTHPLLFDYKEQHGSLYYSGHCTEHYKLFADLFAAHLNICGTFIPFTQYLNNGKDFISVLKATSALLAKGPRNVLQQYGHCLQQYNLTYNLMGSSLPKHWDGEKYVEATPDIKLLLLGESYFVGEDFVFSRK
jgi:hypothetical protein